MSSGSVRRKECERLVVYGCTEDKEREESKSHRSLARVRSRDRLAKSHWWAACLERELGTS